MVWRLRPIKKLGIDFSLSALQQDYDAVCLAVGASLASEMRYQGTNHDGHYLGVDFLKRSNTR